MRKSIERKVSKIKELVNEINKFKIITLVSLEGISSKQLQKLRHELSDKLTLYVTAKNNILRALKESGKPGLESIRDYIKGSCCLGFSKEDPFKLSLIINNKKTPAPAKAGDKAPIDIIIKAGPTPFTPGPMITDLASVGIKTKVEAGKLSIISDVTIAKAGEAINSQKASLMTRFGLTPMRAGLSLLAVYEGGKVRDAKELIIDIDYYKSKLSKSYLDSLGADLTITKLITSLIQYSHMQALNLAFNTRIITKESASQLLAQGFAEALALASKIKWEVK